MKKDSNKVIIIFMIVLHLLPFSIFFIDVRTIDWILLILFYSVNIFFIGAGYHRYFSHKTYKTSRFFQFFLGFFSQITLQGGVLKWTCEHRKHHLYSDKKDDVHSPVQKGFWFSHIAWLFNGELNKFEKKYVQDLIKYKELVILDKLNYWPSVLVGFLFLYFGGISTLIVSYFLGILLTFHATWCINSITHIFGKKRYETNDESRNNWLISIITFGEGWHNNHHKFSYSLRQGLMWWEYDLTFYILKFLSFFHIVWDIKKVPKNLI